MQSKKLIIAVTCQLSLRIDSEIHTIHCATPLPALIGPVLLLDSHYIITDVMKHETNLFGEMF